MSSNTPAMSCSSLPEFKIEVRTDFDQIVTFFLGFGVIVVTSLLVSAFAFEWQQETSYRSWILLAFVAPMSYASKDVWNRCWRSWHAWGYIEVLVDSTSTNSAELFHALEDCLLKVAESSDDTASCQMEGFTVYDKTLGRTQVHFRYFSRSSRTVHLILGGSRKLRVTFSSGDEVICGRNNALTRRESLLLQMKASRSILADKLFLEKWLLECVENYKKPADGVVEVIALHQSSTDWVPEWKTSCVCVCGGEYVCVCVCVCVYAYVCVSDCVRDCVYACVSISVYVCLGKEIGKVRHGVLSCTPLLSWSALSQIARALMLTLRNCSKSREKEWETDAYLEKKR